MAAVSSTVNRSHTSQSSVEHMRPAVAGEITGSSVGGVSSSPAGLPPAVTAISNHVIGAIALTPAVTGSPYTDSGTENGTRFFVLASRQSLPSHPPRLSPAQHSTHRKKSGTQPTPTSRRVQGVERAISCWPSALDPTASASIRSFSGLSRCSGSLFVPFELLRG